MIPIRMVAKELNREKIVIRLETNFFVKNLLIPGKQPKNVPEKNVWGKKVMAKKTKWTPLFLGFHQISEERFKF